MNDLTRSFRLEGQIRFGGRDLYAASVDAVAVRRHIGMVFQQPNPFAMSIFDNVAFGLRINRVKGNPQELVEEALRGAALWDELRTNSRKAACHFPAANSKDSVSRAVLLQSLKCS